MLQKSRRVLREATESGSLRDVLLHLGPKRRYEKSKNNPLIWCTKGQTKSAPMEKNTKKSQNHPVWALAPLQRNDPTMISECSCLKCARWWRCAAGVRSPTKTGETAPTSAQKQNNRTTNQPCKHAGHSHIVSFFSLLGAVNGCDNVMLSSLFCWSCWRWNKLTHLNERNQKWIFRSQNSSTVLKLPLKSLFTKMMCHHLLNYSTHYFDF